MTSDVPRGDKHQISLRLLVALTGCWFLAQMGYYAQAQLFGPVMERYHLDEAAVGLLMSQELMTYAFTAILMAGPVTRLPRSTIALLGGVIVFFSNIISGYTDSFEILRLARLATGFGAGMIGAAGTAAAASSANPQRMFAVVSVCAARRTRNLQSWPCLACSFTSSARVPCRSSWNSLACAPVWTKSALAKHWALAASSV